MRQLPDTTRSDGYSETPDETGDIAAAFTRKDHYQELISRADTVPITRLFKQYGIRLDEYNKKIACPFKAHKGGRETTPSFYFYPETNSFYCFGCHIGGKNAHGCSFVAEMDRITRVQAAHKVLELFAEDVDEDNVYDQSNFSEKLAIMMDFSNAVHEFYQTFSSEEAGVYIEVACKKYDALSLKHKNLDNEALRSVVKQLKDYINLYKP